MGFFDGWIDWSKTTRSKNYRGSGSFATLMIIGRMLAHLSLALVWPFCAKQLFLLKRRTWPIANSFLSQPHASSSAFSSPRSPTTSLCYGARSRSPPNSCPSLKRTSGSCTPPRRSSAACSTSWSLSRSPASSSSFSVPPKPTSSLTVPL